MRQGICCIFNIGPHYRTSIYKMMDQKLGCDFYFGDKVESPLKTMDYRSLNGYKHTVKNIRLFNTGFLWQSGVLRLAFGPYKHFILTGSPYILSNHVLSLFARVQNKRIYLWTHGVKGNSNWKKRILERFTFFMANKVLLYGDFAKNNMIQQGYSNDKLVPVYNSLDYEEQLIVRNQISSNLIFEEHFNNKNPVLIYIGRIQKSKKINLLIEAVAKLKSQNIFCNLVIIGKDIEGNEMPSLVDFHDLNQAVWFYGPCYDENLIGNLIYNSDVCISPGLIGLTAIHSLTYGTPVLTSNQFNKHGPEFEAIVPGSTGDFFKDGDLEDLVRTIKKWISLNKIEREAVREKAYRIIDERYNPFNQLKIIKRILKIA